MEIKTVNPAVSPNPPEPPPALTRFETIANAGIEGLDAIRAQLPELESPHPDTVRFAQTMKGFKRQYLDAAIDVVKRTPAVQDVGRLDVPAAQNQLSLVDGLRTYRNALKKMLVELDFTIDINYARAMNKALQILPITRALARDAALGATLTTEVSLMEEMLGRAGIRKAAGTDTQEPPAPPAAPPFHENPAVKDH